ncbi:MAG TPA: hypothetical protein VMD76_00895 [Candidatus Sulfotelmatobacter sp.]|jgi:hypothetical protein|nr:hypothetical protein [Candidatus Sulfotelmatobacter sp.]
MTSVGWGESRQMNRGQKNYWEFLNACIIAMKITAQKNCAEPWTKIGIIERSLLGFSERKVQ